MRTFISISIPQELQQILANIQSELKLFPENRIAWVRPHQSHITLKFLGETTEEEISDISNCLIDIGKEFSPIQFNGCKSGWISKS